MSWRRELKESANRALPYRDVSMDAPKNLSPSPVFGSVIVMSDSITVDRRFRGPPDSGNGGYSCGRLAQFIDGPACVRLRVPPPLEVALQVTVADARVELHHGDRLVAEAWPALLDIAIPAPPSQAEAVEAAKHFRAFDNHFFPSCFVCGTGREHDGGLQVFAGPVAGRAEQVALVWQPDASLADETGTIKPEFIWSALDCPGAYSFTPADNHFVLLGELNAELYRLPKVGDALRLLGWNIKADGRKHTTGTALFDVDDRCIAAARAIWFEVAVEE